MFITEFVLPTLKQDAQTRATFLSTVLPSLIGLLSTAPGKLASSHGFMIEENDINVESFLKPVIGVGMSMTSPHIFHLS